MGGNIGENYFLPGGLSQNYMKNVKLNQSLFIFFFIFDFPSKLLILINFKKTV